MGSLLAVKSEKKKLWSASAFSMSVVIVLPCLSEGAHFPCPFFSGECTYRIPSCYFLQPSPSSVPSHLCTSRQHPVFFPGYVSLFPLSVHFHLTPQFEKLVKQTFESVCKCLSSVNRAIHNYHMPCKSLEDNCLGINNNYIYIYVYSVYV